MRAMGVAAQDWWHEMEIIRRTWTFLSEAELDEVAGDRERLIAKIEERYGLSRNRAECWVLDYLGPVV